MVYEHHFLEEIYILRDVKVLEMNNSGIRIVHPELTLEINRVDGNFGKRAVLRYLREDSESHDTHDFDLSVYRNEAGEMVLYHIESSINKF